MATLEINGRRVQVDDGFRSMSPEQQQATVEEIAWSMGVAQQPQPRADENADLWQPGTPFEPNGGSSRADPEFWAREVAGAVPGVVNAWNEGNAEGIPVVGPMVTEAGLRAGAGLSSLFSGEPYDEALSGLRDFREQRMEGHEGARLAGNVAGAVAPLGLAAATPVGGQMLGVTGTLPSRVLAGGASGAGIAAFDTAARGGDFDDTWKMALLGGGVGAALPLAERPAAAIMRMLAGQRGAAPAERALDTMLQRERIAPQNLTQSLDDIGPGAMPVDLGRGTQYQGGAIANLPGEGQTIMSDALTARNVGTNARIQGDVNELLGQSVGPRAFNQQVTEQQRALSPLYEDAFANARAVDTSPVALNLDALAVNSRGEAQSVARQLRDMLNVYGEDVLDPNPRTLFEVRRAIDGMMDGVTDGNARRVLSDTRRQVDDLLADAVPGIKAADAQYADLARQREAYETGQSALDSARSSLTPTDLQQMVAESADSVVGALSAGARADIDRLIGTTANNITALKTALRGDGSWNRQRLATLFGQDRADQLLSILEREARFNQSYNTVLQNSATAGRQGAMAERAPNEVTLSIQRLLTGIPQGMANAAARSRSQSTNAQIAELLTNRPSPELVDRLLAIRSGSRGTIAPASIAALLTNQGGAN